MELLNLEKCSVPSESCSASYKSFSANDEEDKDEDRDEDKEENKDFITEMGNGIHNKKLVKLYPHSSVHLVNFYYDQYVSS
jgi:hypothetical protein